MRITWGQFLAVLVLVILFYGWVQSKGGTP